MGRTRNANNRNGRSHGEDEGEFVPSVPRTVLVDRMVAQERDSDVQSFLQDRRYDNVDRTLPTYVVRNDLFDQIAVEDYISMQSQEICVTPEVKELMLMQSIPGHAASGHGRFYRRARFTNANIEWVYQALGVDPAEIRGRRQEIINQIFKFASRILENPHAPSLHHARGLDGKPLGGAELYANVFLENPVDVLVGMYLGSCMDSYYWRTRVKNRFHDLEMGGGKNFAVNLERMLEEKLTLEDLSTHEHSPEDIANLIKRGIIIDSVSVQPSESIVNGYVRLKRGYGVSDDAAVITAGIKYRKGAAIGVLLVDAVDTWDKSTPLIYPGGWDEMLGRMILQESEHHGIQMPSDEAVEEFIYLSSINPMRVTLYPDCSQRRFLQQYAGDGKVSCAAELHLKFIDRIHELKAQEARDCKSDRESSLLPNGRLLHGLPDLNISYRGVSSNAFYSTYRDRFNKAHEQGLILH